MQRIVVALTACGIVWGCAAGRRASSTGTPIVADDGPVRASAAGPLSIGESFTIESRVMGETRHINVYKPTVYGQAVPTPIPVLYMLDGGLDEDFLHVAGLVQVLVSNGGMRPFLLVGIPNTSRRRDMTGPTTSDEDRKIAPVVGGSATFRRFIREELIPTVRARYSTTDEAAIVGESLAGLFVLETFVLEPDLFGTHIAIDPSLWWNHGALLEAARDRLAAPLASRASVFVASSNEPVIAGLAARLAAEFQAHAGGDVRFQYAPLPAESHATIYHPAALLAFRTVFASAREGK